MDKIFDSKISEILIGLKKIRLIQKIKTYIWCISLILFFSLTQGCSKKEPVCACGVEHPEENIPWLKNILENTFCTEIYTLIYERIEYLVVCDCPEVVDGMIVFYDCQGNKICEWGGFGSICNMPNEFTYEIYKQNRKLIYTQP